MKQAKGCCPHDIAGLNAMLKMIMLMPTDTLTDVLLFLRLERAVRWWLLPLDNRDTPSIFYALAVVVCRCRGGPPALPHHASMVVVRYISE